MNENNDIQITVEACRKDTGACSMLDLKVPRAEAVKLQTVAISKGETVDYLQYKEFFAVSFGVTLSFWLLAKVAGVALSLIKRY